MPTYEYACSACGHEWDQVQRITEPPVELCPQCEKAAAHRLISRGTNFILKGGGWYSDLYSSSKGSAKPESVSGEGAAKAESPSEGKSEGKSESKAAAPPAAAPATATTPASTSPTSS